tara:strand:- start:443 stop:1891 length:1449 start_codon:yes stop_codon:yes gene_type:complete
MKHTYITTSIAYTNAKPHIGFALESIQADVLARYHHLQNEDVFFLTGTDEHGQKIAQTAQKVGKNPQEFVDQISESFEELTKVLNLSNNGFIRTTDRKKHWPSVEKVWNTLKDNDDIYEKEYTGYYCSGCEAFVTKRKGDESGCLNHPKIKLELVKEKNWFFKLSKYSDKIKKAIESDQLKIVPETRKNEVLGIIDSELEDVSFSRSTQKLTWGVPVPNDSSQTIYVWADALTNYLSALDYVNNGEKFKKYWPADVHCIGKDILKFHALIWPGILLSLGLDLPRTIFVHGFISVDGQKMSKSLGNVVDPFELVEKYGTDAVRYYLLREIPSSEDGDFTFEKFESRYNSDLAGGIGNLLARTRTMAEKQSIQGLKPSKDIQKEVKKIKDQSQKELESFKFNLSLSSIWELISFCDKYIEKEKPWEGRDSAGQVLRDLIFALEQIGDLLKPFLPETSQKILDEIAEDGKGFKNVKSKSLFPRIT